MSVILDRVAEPAAEKFRIQALDVIRGLSILGILAVNADGYAAPISASLNPAAWPYPDKGWTAISYWVMDAFFHEKFVTLFSMLFGVSLFLVGGERSDKKKERVLWRRLAVLFAFAMLHGFGIWWGDILSLYACTGVIMLFFRSWNARTLMVVGVLLYATMAVRESPAVAHLLAPHAGPAQISAPLPAPPVAAVKPRANITAAIDEARSSWSGAYHANTRSYLRVLSGDPWLVPSTLGLMMIGLSLFKSGFLSARSSSRRYGVTSACGAVALGAVAWLTWEKDVLMTPVWNGRTLELLLAPLVSVGYASGLILLQRSRFVRFLSPLAAAGRMAFTNYLTQSLIMTFLFYGGRGGLMGEVNRPALWGIVIAVWALQLIWSSIWLSRFEMGPFEWVWRSLTYGRRAPILKPQ